MKIYYLKTKSGETISQIKADSIVESIELFPKIKKLNKKELLEIYKVDKDENRGIDR